MLIDDFDAGGDFVPIVWVRNGNADGNQTYDWLLVRNQTNDQRVTSIYFLEGATVLAEDTPATWPVGQWHVDVEMDAELGEWSATFTHDGGTTNTLTRDFTSSIVPQGGQSLRLIWGWASINKKIVYPPWGWTFSELTVRMEPGGPFGPDAPECPGGLDWVTDALPDGTVDVAYGPVALEAVAGTGVYAFTVEAGLPAGLSVDAGGEPRWHADRERGLRRDAACGGRQRGEGTSTGRSRCTSRAWAVTTVRATAAATGSDETASGEAGGAEAGASGGPGESGGGSAGDTAGTDTDDAPARGIRPRGRARLRLPRWACAKLAAVGPYRSHAKVSPTTNAHTIPTTTSIREALWRIRRQQHRGRRRAA